MGGYAWSHYTSVGDCFRSPLACMAPSGDIFGRTVMLVMLVTFAQYLFSLMTLPTKGESDPSIVDRLWSIMPWLYTWIWYVAASFRPQGASARQLLMACL